MVLISNRRRGWQCDADQRAFTLVEVIVAISIITLLVAIVLVSLSGVRERARSAACLAALHDASTCFTTFADQANRGRYPNALEPGQLFARWTLGSTLWISSTCLDQTRQWMGPFAAAGWVDQGLEDARYMCPSAIRSIAGTTRLANPQILPHRSFAYSAGLYTDPVLWDVAHPDRRNSPDDWRHSVGLHEVDYPDRKALLFETGDHHGSRLLLGEFGVGKGRTNVVACDGHTTNVDPYAGEPALPVPWTLAADGVPFSGAMPFSSSANGCRGRDW